MRFYFLAVMLGVPVFLIGPMSIFFYRNRRRFLLETPVLKSVQDVDALKRLAKVEMYGALMMLPLTFIAPITFFVGLALEVLTYVDVLYVVAAGILITLQGLLGKISEKQVYAMPTATPELAAERDRIVQVCAKKMLPDW